MKFRLPAKDAICWEFAFLATQQDAPEFWNNKNREEKVMASLTAAGSRPLRFAVFGCGFWSRFQIAGWFEVGGVEEDIAKQALIRVARKMPYHCRFVARRHGL